MMASKTSTIDSSNLLHLISHHFPQSFDSNDYKNDESDLDSESDDDSSVQARKKPEKAKWTVEEVGAISNLCSKFHCFQPYLGRETTESGCCVKRQKLEVSG